MFMSFLNQLIIVLNAEMEKEEEMEEGEAAFSY